MQTCKADLYFYPHKTTAISKEKKMKQHEIISLVYQKKKSIMKMKKFKEQKKSTKKS